jgi:ribosome-binding factor A
VPYKRTDRVNALLQRELGQLISEELTDPRISFATVTAVETTPDLKTARVHVSVLGAAEEVRETMRALEGARHHLRREIGRRTDLRYVPDLVFMEDRTAESAARISRLLREAAKRAEGEPMADHSEAKNGKPADG